MPRAPGYRIRQVGTLARDEPPGTAGEESQPGAPRPGAAVEPAGAPEPARASGGLWRRVGPVGAVAVLGVLGTIGFGLAWGLSDTGPSTNAAVTDSARNLVLALTNFDPGTVSADFSRVQSEATGAFAKQARRVFGSSIRRELETAHAASRGKIEDLYIQSVSGSRASVFAVVQQTYLNTKTSVPVRDTLRMVLGLTDTSSGWLTSSVRVLEQPVSAVTSK